MLRSLRRCSAYFLATLLIAPFSTLAHAWAPNEPLLKGQDAGIIVGLSLLLLSVFLWLFYRSGVRWSTSGLTVILVALALWAWEFWRVVNDQSGYNYLAFAMPVILFMVLWKRPYTRDGHTFFAVLGAAVVLSALIAYVAGALELMPDGFTGPEGGIESRYPLLGLLLGAETRWIGPFGSVNYTAAAGGLAIVCGLASPRWLHWFLIASGMLMLLLTQGDAATFAAGMAALVFVLWGVRASSIPWLSKLRLPALGLLLVVAGVIVALQDGALDVRLSVWRNFTQLWLDAPLLGAGTPGVYAFINANQGVADFVPYTHAHSVILNGVSLYGIPWAVGMLVILGTILVLAWRATDRVGSGPLAVVVFVILGGLAETTYMWSAWSLFSAALLAVLVTVAPPGPGHRNRRASDYVTSMTQGEM